MKKLIEKILKDFNFEKVHKAMQVTNWGWVNSEGKVPSIGRLVLRAEELLQDVSKMDIGCSIGTGGFVATKMGSEDFGEGLQLEFILTSRMLYKDWLDEE